jgi:hypothetical protein
MTGSMTGSIGRRSPMAIDLGPPISVRAEQG